MENQIEELIAKGQIKEAFDLSLQTYSSKNTALKKDLILLSAQYYKISNDKILGLGEKAEKEALLVKALLEKIESLDGEASVETVSNDLLKENKAHVYTAASPNIKEGVKTKEKAKINLARISQFLTYLGGMALLLTAYHVLTDTLKYPGWLAFSLAIIPLLLTVLTHAFPNWLDLRRKKRIMDIAVGGTIPEPGYFRLTPYEAKDKDRYVRADGMHIKVLNWITKTKRPLLYLNGDSGTGKSSLLNAFVLPELKEDKNAFETLVVRGYEDPVKALTNELKGMLSDNSENAFEELETLQLLELTTYSLANKRFLVIFDQFEEFLIIHDDKDRTELETLLNSICGEVIPGLTVMLVFRSDYLPELNNFKIAPMVQGDNWMQVGLFNLRASKEFLQDSGLKINDDLFFGMAREAEVIEGRRGLIRPIVLNMFGIILQRFDGHLPREMEPGSLLRSYLKEAINAKDIQNESGLILRKMITKAGTKSPISLNQLEKETGIKRNFLQGFMLKLAPQGIVRRIDIVNEVWEISHDFIAQLLGRVIYGWRPPQIPKLLAWVGPTALIIAAAAVFFLTPLALDWRHDAAVRSLDNNYGISVRKLDENGYQATLRDRESLDSTVSESVFILFQDIKFLKLLSLSNSTFTSLKGLENLDSLQRLTIWRNNLKSLNDVGNLPHLKTLSLSYSDSLVDLDGLTKLVSLEKIELNENNLKSLNGVRGHPSLKSIDFSSSFFLKSLEGLDGLDSLEEINLSNSAIESLVGIGNLPNLKKLNLGSTDDLTSLEGLVGLDSLEEINLTNSAIESLVGISDLPNLKKLNLGSTGNLTSLEGLVGLDSLEEISLSYSLIASLDGIGNLPNLKKLNLVSTNNLTSLEGLVGLDSLEEINLYDSAIESLVGIGNLPNLKVLYLNRTNNLTSLEGLDGLDSLEKIDLSSSLIASLDGIGNLPNLKVLNLSRRYIDETLFGNDDRKFERERIEFYLKDELKRFDSIGKLKNLELLDLSGRKITSLDFIRNISKIKEIILRDCNSLTQLSGLSGMQNLEFIDLRASSITSLQNISNLPSLKVLDLSSTNNLTSLNGLDGLDSLEFIDLRASSITSLQNISNLPSLKVLDLSSTNNLTSLEGLDDLDNLEELSLRGSRITSLNGISNLSNLKELNLVGASRLTSIKELLNLDRLEIVFLNRMDLSKFSKEIKRLKSKGVNFKSNSNNIFYR